MAKLLPIMQSVFFFFLLINTRQIGKLYKKKLKMHSEKNVLKIIC